MEAPSGGELVGGARRVIEAQMQELLEHQKLVSPRATGRADRPADR